MFLGLRELSGVDLGRIERQYDVHWDGRIADLCAQGLLERDGSRIRLAPAKLALANEVFVAFLD
jgi:coproporphyrinogen III oxidase-like Fe-S oxidoreductase